MLAALACAAMAPGVAEAQRGGSLVLYGLPSAAYSGDTLTFSGYLSSSGNPVSGATIYIKDNVRFGGDSVIKTLRTDSSGYFSGTWTARERSSGAWDFYAVFEGSRDVKKARSSEYSVTVYPRQSGSPDAGYVSRQHEGVLYLDRIPSSASAGDQIRFSGSLTTTSGYSVPDATIYIKDNVRFGSDQVIATLRTDSSGYFAGTWTARERSSGAWDFYAVFDGSQQVTKARSSQYSITVADLSARTSVVLDAPPSSVHVGDAVTFTGTVLAGGRPIQWANVEIREDDRFRPDSFLASGQTGSDGRFAIHWRAEKDLIERDLDIFAEFTGGSGYEKSQSARHQVTVSKFGGSLTLDPVPASARIGEIVTFSGRLSIDGHNPEGAAVYVMDRDRLNPDDMLASAYVDASGRFSANWFVEHVDPTNTIEIYAVFEGGGNLGRLTTCDRGVTWDWGGFCLDVKKLKVLDQAPSQPRPRGEDEYMELYYSLNLRSPHVAIVPTPESYSKVSGHIVPVQEGILMWKPLLEDVHGGKWDVSFEVVHPGGSFRQKPDIIMDLVTSDQDSGCIGEYAGWAQVWENPPSPINTVVCSDGGHGYRSSADVSFIAAHEFIHAMGLGHAFNKPGDMMCSIEDGVPTCGTTAGMSKTPSVLNLEAVGCIYGRDGFPSPNNPVRYEERFRLDGGCRGEGAPGAGTTSTGARPPAKAGGTYDHPGLGISFKAPRGWKITHTSDQPEVPGSLAAVMTGPKMGLMEPTISLKIREHDKTFVAVASERDAEFSKATEHGYDIISRKRGTFAGLPTYEMVVEGPFNDDGTPMGESYLRGSELTIYTGDTAYSFTHINDIVAYAAQYGSFEEMLSSLKIRGMDPTTGADGGTYENEDLGVSFRVPHGWTARDLSGSDPWILALDGPKAGAVSPIMGFGTIEHGMTLDEVASYIDSGYVGSTHGIISVERGTVAGLPSFEVEEGVYSPRGFSHDQRATASAVYTDELLYVFMYMNDAEVYERQVGAFRDLLATVRIR